MDDKRTERIIGAAVKVHRILGPGFLERVYENELAHELRTLGAVVQQRVPLPVLYEGVVVGDYIADLMIDSAVLVELKALVALQSNHVGQCIHYLTATQLPLCLLLNFGASRLEFKRITNRGAARSA